MSSYKCDVCQKVKTLNLGNRPVVALPMTDSVNQMVAMDMAHALMAPAPAKMDSVVQIAKLQFAQVNQSAMAKVSVTELMESAHVNKDSLAVTVGSKLAQ